MKKTIVLCIICTLFILTFFDIYRASKLSSQFDILQKDDIDKLGSNRQNKYIWTSGKGMINFSPD
jgi:hypothetical protein